jgi:hypothetical protein
MGMRQLVQKGMVVALAAGMTAVLAATAAMAQTTGITTHTTLATATQQIGGRAVTTYSATVLGEDGAPATGAVTLVERGKILAGAALNSAGKAQIRVDGLTGDHTLTAVYSGDPAHANSTSESIDVHPQAVSADSFALGISPASLTVAAPGGAAELVATITSGTNFTGFVSLSCAGPPVSAGSYTDSAMPVGVTCIFTPENVQVTSAIAGSSNPTVTSHLTVQTTAPAGQAGMRSRDAGNPLVLAILLPGVIGLGVLGRKRKLFGRVALLLAVGAISVLGTTACAARYRYLNHPPTANDGTPPGSYTLTIWAQTSNGVTASEQFTTMALSVN